MHAVLPEKSGAPRAHRVRSFATAATGRLVVITRCGRRERVDVIECDDPSGEVRCAECYPRGGRGTRVPV